VTRSPWKSALVSSSPAVTEGTAGQAGVCWNLTGEKGGPLSAAPPRPPPPRPPRPAAPPALLMVANWVKLATVTTARAPFLAPYCSGVRKSVQASPRGFGAAAPRPPRPAAAGWAAASAAGGAPAAAAASPAAPAAGVSAPL